MLALTGLCEATYTTSLESLTRLSYILIFDPIGLPRSTSIYNAKSLEFYFFQIKLHYFIQHSWRNPNKY